jgi:aminoglycoside phosphotransferase (APT) family kinase protein
VSTSADSSNHNGRLAGKLAAFLSHRWNVPGLQISDLSRHATGMSRENWTFGAHWNDGGSRELALILRRDPPGSMLETDRQCEYTVLQTLRQCGLPVPATHGADLTGEHLDRPSLIMEIVPGECDYFAVTGNSRPLAVRLQLAREFLDLLARMQAIDWRSVRLNEVLPEPPDPAFPSLFELDRWTRELRRVQLEPAPELDLTANWLRARAPRAQRIVLVHGDFKPGNALIHNDSVSALLDWETAHLGDPLEDLGWLTNPARANEFLIPTHWDLPQIKAAFEERLGDRVAPADLHWWNVFACWKLAIIVLTGIHALVDGRLQQIHHAPTFLYRRMLAMTGR